MDLPPKMLPVDKLEKRASSAESSQEGAWWISVQMTQHLLTAMSRRDEHTGRGLPDSLVGMLRRLDEALEARPRPLPMDTVFRALELCDDATRAVLTEPRTKLVRQHEMVPIHAAGDVDQKTMRWLGRLPGRTVREKLAGRTKIKAPKRRFSADTDENRVVRRLLGIIEEQVEARYDFIDSYDPNDEVRRRLERIRQTYDMELRRSPLADIPPAVQMRANNVMIDDRRYARIWRGAQLLKRRNEIAMASWQKMPERARELLFWGLVTRLTQAPTTTLWDRPGLIAFDDGDENAELSLAYLADSPGSLGRWHSRVDSEQLAVELWVQPDEGEEKSPHRSRHSGEIKTIDPKENGSTFGFIRRPDAGDVYFDKSSLQDPQEFRALNAGDPVTFELGAASNGKSPPAKNLTVGKVVKDIDAGHILRIALQNQTLSGSVEKLTGAGRKHPKFAGKSWEHEINFDSSSDLVARRGMLCSIPFEMLGNQLNRGRPIDPQGLSELIDMFEEKVWSLLDDPSPESRRQHNPDSTVDEHDPESLKQSGGAVAIDICQSRPQIHPDGYGDLHTTGYAVGYDLGDSIFWQIDDPTHPVLPPTSSDLSATIRSVFATAAEESTNMFSGVREIVEEFASLPSLAAADATGYTVPDLADEAGKRRLRRILEGRLRPRRVVPVWRSVAAATGWQQSEMSDLSDNGQLVLVFDAEGPQLTIVPLVSRCDDELADEHPNTNGIYWERHPPLLPDDADELLTFDRLLTDYTTKLIESTCGEALPQLVRYIVDSGRAEILLEQEQLTVPVADDSKRWLCLGHDAQLWDQTLQRWFDLFDQRVTEAFESGHLDDLLDDYRVHTALLAGKPFARLDVRDTTSLRLPANSNDVEERTQGTVKFANSDDGYGFITQSDGKEDVFFHRGSLRNSNLFDELRENTPVTFKCKQGKKGPKAEELLVGLSSATVPSSSIVQGTQALTHRAHNQQMTWSEWTPDLGIEVIRDGHFGFLPLVNGDTAIAQHTGKAESIDIPETLRLPANCDHVLLPMLSGDDGRNILGLQACFSGGSLPLAENTPIHLQFTYRPGVDGNWSLTASAADPKARKFQDSSAKWITHRSSRRAGLPVPKSPNTSSDPPSSVERADKLFTDIENHRDDTDECKTLIHKLDKALGDGHGERAELVKKTLDLIRSFRTAEQFNPALLNATLSALGDALWKSPELIQRLPEIDEEAVELLLQVSDHGLRNIAARLPSLVDEVQSDPSLEKNNLKIYASPYCNICQLLLALVKLRNIAEFPLLSPTSKRIERITRYIRRVDYFLADTPGQTKGHEDLKKIQKTNRTRAPRPKNLANVSDLGYQTIFFLLGGPPPLPELVS